MCFCFNVLSSKLFLDSLFPSETTLKRQLCATFVTLQVPWDKSLANMVTSHSDGLPHRMRGVGKGEASIGSRLGRMSQLVPNKATAGWLPPSAPVFASSLEQERLFVSNHPQRVFSYCLTDLRIRHAVCFPGSLAPCNPVFCLGLPQRESREFIMCRVWSEQQKMVQG